MAPEEQSQSFALPFEPITVLIGFTRRWKFFVLAMILSVAAGIALAYLFGKSTYETSMMLLYKGFEGTKDEGPGRSSPISTASMMVKIPSNLNAINEKLNLGATLKSLGQACVVTVEKRTSLVTIKVQWSSRKLAAKIADTLGDVFIESQVRLSKAENERKIREYEGRLKKTVQELNHAQEDLKSFVAKNKIVNVAKDLQWHQDRLTSLELLAFNARNERDTAQSQRQTLLERIEAVKAQVAQEKSETPQTQSLADLNIRIERLRRAIHDDREKRKNEVGLEKFKQDFERSKQLYDKGLISQKEYEEAKANFETQEVKTLETDQITEWKRQLKVLEGTVIPAKDSFKSPAQELLQSLQVKAADMELQALSLQKKAAYLRDEMLRVKERLGELTDLHGRYTTLSQRIESLQSEKTGLEQALAKERREYDSTDKGFAIVSTAPVPTVPLKSNKKIIFAVVVFLGTMFSFSAILVAELLDTTIKSGAELQQKTAIQVIAMIPGVKSSQQIFPDTSSSVLIETFRIVSRRIRREVPEMGARVMITSADRGEGKTMVTANLAACFGRQDERVLVMDAQIRDIPSERDLRYLISEEDKPLKGLGEWLSFEADRADEIVWHTVLPGVQCIPHVKEAVIPDLLGSNRMKDLLEELSESFSLILIDGPSVSDYVDAELVAQWCDAVVFLVRSRTCTSSSLRSAVERVRSTGVPLIGTILSDVDPVYLKWG